MRPVRRRASPQGEADFIPYDKAKPYLISRLGLYCSFCERLIPTSLAVEHILPKELYPHLIGRWDNFLLACVNCNSTKYKKELSLEQILLPDRDNTFLAFTYSPDGLVAPSRAAIDAGLAQMASNTLALTGLDKKSTDFLDENDKRVALDRMAQRLEVWLLAKECQSDIDDRPKDETLRRRVVCLAQKSGFFSLWMTVFQNDADMQNRLIDAFAGTRESGCFDPETANAISPAPNPDLLAHGGKL